MTAWQTLMSRHEWKSCSTSHVRHPICLRFYIFEQNSALNICLWCHLDTISKAAPKQCLTYICETWYTVTMQKCPGANVCLVKWLCRGPDKITKKQLHNQTAFVVIISPCACCNFVIYKCDTIPY